HVPARKSKATAWNEFEAAIEVRETKAAKIISFRGFIPAAAAAVAIIFIASWMIIHKVNRVEILVAQGNTHTVILPDESTVKLNAGTSISYRKWKFNENRKVSLQGEAFFEVKPAGSFTVVSDSRTIEVLGTSFNVYSRSNSFRVQCLSGKVKVVIKDANSIVLSRGQAVKTKSGNSRPEVYTVDTLKATSWIRGEFWYDAEPLASVLEEIERQFNITIESPDNNERLYTGYFKNNDLKTALENVCVPMSLQFEITGQEKVKIW
ncbi:MAG: FecR domain-containing protein, partial [Prolixibacteraceae bacterium]|nr:FecR domain-containing protein [Prolixibacteraceae bacterium]